MAHTTNHGANVSSAGLSVGSATHSAAHVSLIAAGRQWGILSANDGLRTSIPNHPYVITECWDCPMGYRVVRSALLP
jgi:hypothetical protein